MKPLTYSEAFEEWTRQHSISALIDVVSSVDHALGNVHSGYWIASDGSWWLVSVSDANGTESFGRSNRTVEMNNWRATKTTGIVDLGFGWTIDTWYDRHTRSYVTQLKHDGCQIGDASIYGTKAGIRGAVDAKRKEHLQINGREDREDVIRRLCRE